VRQDPYAVDAPYYDAIHDAFDDDIGLWASLAGRTDRPVLEVGCGSGRIAVELAAAGYRVTGLDPSPTMLALGRQRAAARGAAVTFVEGTALDGGFAADTFGLVLVPLDVFLYCEDGPSQVATLRALAGAMTYNGTLVLDLPGPALWLDPASDGQPELVYSGETAAGTRFDCWHLHFDDLAAQTRELRVTYESLNQEGLVLRHVSEHRLRYVYPAELEYLLAAAGLELSGLFGDYELGPLTNDSARMVATARRSAG